MAKSTFLYVTYVRSTPEKLWSALTDTEFMRHGIERDPSKLIEAVSRGWPKAIANLKSLLENGVIALQDPYPTSNTGLGTN